MMQKLKKGQRVIVVRSGERYPATVAKTTTYNEAFPFVLVHLTEVGTTLLVRWSEIEQKEKSHDEGRL